MGFVGTLEHCCGVIIVMIYISVMICISERFLVRQVGAKGAGGRNHVITVDLNIYTVMCAE